MTNHLYDALVRPHAANDAPFLICDDGSTTSYRAFVAQAAQMAHALTNAGASPGDRVVVQTAKLPQSIALFAGAVQAGLIYLPLNTAYTETELAYFITDADPALVICDTSNVDKITALCAGTQAQVLTIDADKGGSLDQALEIAPNEFDTVPRGPDDLAALLYTSGTTGRSKGAMMSHRNLLSNAEALVDLWRITDTDRLLHALPIFHTHGLFVAMNTSLLAGAEVRFMQGFDSDTSLGELPQSTLMMGVPTFYTRLLANDRFGADTCANMRLFISGSAPLLAETHTAFESRTGHRILERYGMTETNMITSNPYDGDRVAGTVGFALPGCEVMTTDNGEPVPAGEIGMIEVRGDNVFQGYWNMPEKTKEELRDTGFFITGDLGVMDDQGRVSIVGRQKDLIIAGGYNIYPKEIEDILNDVAGVKESAVFGVPHPDFGESVLAAVVPEGAVLDEAKVRPEVESKLAKFKHPRRYIILQELPRNTMGKVQKNVLRDRYST